MIVIDGAVVLFLNLSRFFCKVVGDIWSGCRAVLFGDHLKLKQSFLEHRVSTQQLLMSGTAAAASVAAMIVVEVSHGQSKV